MEVLSQLPEKIFQSPPNEIHQFLDDLSLVHLRGKKKDALVLGVMLHGNEPRGYYVIQEWFSRHFNSKKTLPRDVIILFGNLAAGKHARRYLDHQKDHNRIWTDELQTPRSKEVMGYLRQQNVFLTLDFHNSSGRNPYYTAISRLTPENIEIASHFSPHAVYYQEPHEAFSAVMANLGPSVTLECGTPDHPEAQNDLLNFMDEIMSWNQIPNHHNRLRKVFRSIGRIHLPHDASVSFDTETADFQFRNDLDLLNFTVVRIGKKLGEVKNSKSRLIVHNVHGHDCGDEFFNYENNEIIVKKEFTPSLISLDSDIVKKDVLGYIMEDMDIDHIR